MGGATYYVVMFQVDPVPLGAPGPIRLKVSRKYYEVACQDAAATIYCPKGKFRITEGSKRIFRNDEENSIYLISDVVKIQE